MKGFEFLSSPERNDYQKLIHDQDRYFDEAGVDYFTELPQQKSRIEEGNWDVVFLFDALRWDAAKIALQDYEVEPLQTQGAHTPVWLQNTWTQKHPNLTYVSGSPMTNPELDIEDMPEVPEMENLVGKLIQATHLDEVYDKRLGTALPLELVKIVSKQDPPVFAHLMQPHTPFIGEVILHAKYPIRETNLHQGNGRFYPFVTSGLVDIELVRLAYWMNFIEALRAVDTFLSGNEDLDVVLTADHGEVLYQNRVSHGGNRDPENQIVPWVEISI